MLSGAVLHSPIATRGPGGLSLKSTTAPLCWERGTSAIVFHWHRNRVASDQFRFQRSSQKYNRCAVGTTQREKILIGEAGEHLVLSRLLRLGYVASQAPRSWKADDILVEGGWSVQVKTTAIKARQWMVGNVEPADKLIYALVHFTSDSDGSVYVVPSQMIRDFTDAAHTAYLALHPIKDSPIRIVVDPFRCEVPGFPSGWLSEWREGWTKVLPDPSSL